MTVFVVVVLVAVMVVTAGVEYTSSETTENLVFVRIIFCTLVRVSRSTSGVVLTPMYPLTCVVDTSMSVLGAQEHLIMLSLAGSTDFSQILDSKSYDQA